MQFKRRHDWVANSLAKQSRRDSNIEDVECDMYDQVPDVDYKGELNGAQLRQAESAAAARPGAANQIGDVIQRICVRNNIPLPE